MRRSMVIAASALAVLALAAPAAANETDRWTDTHDIENVFTCGVVEDTVATIDGTAYFAADGSWLKDIIRFSYEATFTDPVTGETASYRTRQIVEGNPDNLVFRGQGLFVRDRGNGAVLLDVGVLVMDPGDGSTVFQSASTLAFDDPTVFDRYDEAICSLF
ncbi:MAG TPA: hypothetical protein VFK54_03975 [Candidatus Limnocylindrales bacterium]|nr:hypothetical protein [Candidatus Limnocylindrales bacterium]